jgi:hypothetical protein
MYSKKLSESLLLEKDCLGLDGANEPWLDRLDILRR